MAAAKELELQEVKASLKMVYLLTALLVQGVE
jgi:hypothetical protein